MLCIYIYVTMARQTIQDMQCMRCMIDQCEHEDGELQLMDKEVRSSGLVLMNCVCIADGTNYM